MFAVAREQPKAARLLLRRGALVNAATHDGVTPLHMAAHCITDDEDAAPWRACCWTKAPMCTR